MPNSSINPYIRYIYAKKIGDFKIRKTYEKCIFSRKWYLYLVLNLKNFKKHVKFISKKYFECIQNLPVCQFSHLPFTFFWWKNNINCNMEIYIFYEFYETSRDIICPLGLPLYEKKVELHFAPSKFELIRILIKLYTLASKIKILNTNIKITKTKIEFKEDIFIFHIQGIFHFQLCAFISFHYLQKKYKIMNADTLRQTLKIKKHRWLSKLRR